MSEGRGHRSPSSGHSRDCRDEQDAGQRDGAGTSGRISSTASACWIWSCHLCVRRGRNYAAGPPHFPEQDG